VGLWVESRESGAWRLLLGWCGWVRPVPSGAKAPDSVGLFMYGLKARTFPS